MTWDGYCAVPMSHPRHFGDAGKVRGRYAVEAHVVSGCRLHALVAEVIAPKVVTHLISYNIPHMHT
jgi:hypothetical protein